MGIEGIGNDGREKEEKSKEIRVVRVKVDKIRREEVERRKRGRDKGLKKEDRKKGTEKEKKSWIASLDWARTGHASVRLPPSFHSRRRAKVRRAAGAQNQQFHPQTNKGDSHVALDSHHYRCSLASGLARRHRRRVHSPAFDCGRGRSDLPLHPWQVPRVNGLYRRRCRGGYASRPTPGYTWQGLGQVPNALAGLPGPGHRPARALARATTLRTRVSRGSDPRGHQEARTYPRRRLSPSSRLGKVRRNKRTGIG